MMTTPPLAPQPRSRRHWLLGGLGCVAAAALTLRGKRKTKSVSPGQQVFVKAKDRVRVLKMPAESRD